MEERSKEARALARISWPRLSRKRKLLAHVTFVTRHFGGQQRELQGLLMVRLARGCVMRGRAVLAPLGISIEIKIDSREAGDIQILARALTCMLASK